MINLYQTNGLVFWSETEIVLREQFANQIRQKLEQILLAQNPAFRFVRIEAPILTPTRLISDSYIDKDLWAFPDENLVLRPETTMGSYLAANELLNSYNVPKYRLPLVVWQHGQSFRKEQDQVLKNMRLKQFWQLEFQILFAANTGNDYYPTVVEAVKNILNRILGKCSAIPSDRLPSYSDETIDIMYDNVMEICSISRRKDYNPNIKNIEVAIGTDRMVYNYSKE